MQVNLSAIRTIFVDPSSNYTAVAVAIAAIVTLVLLVAVSLIAIALPSRKADGEPAGDESPRRRLGCAGWIAVASIALLGVLGGTAIWYRSTSSDRYCAKSCHAMAKPAASWAKSPHDGVSCIRCHEIAGPKGVPINIVYRASDLWAETLHRKSLHRSVPADNCLECHSTLLDAVLSARNGEPFKHRDLVGRSCTECHGKQGHVPHRN